MEIQEKKIKELIPYEKNPRKNDAAVEYVTNSIKEFGFKVPIVIDKNGVIVCGHTRYKAAQRLKLKTVPCIIADDLNDEQIKAFRLADNKVSEKSEWDFDLLYEELDSIMGGARNVFFLLCRHRKRLGRCGIDYRSEARRSFFSRLENRYGRNDTCA